MNKLNLGCGRDKKPGYLNIDNNPACRPDLSHDLNIYPYPLAGNRFKEIIADHVIEHLDNPLKFLQELYRLGASGCEVKISCPHFSGNHIHPLHKTDISTKLFDFMDKRNSEYYGQAHFKVEKIRLSWLRKTDRGKRANLIVRVLNSAINFFANLNIALAERLWCYWVGGFEEIYFKVIIIK